MIWIILLPVPILEARFSILESLGPMEHLHSVLMFLVSILTVIHCTPVSLRRLMSAILLLLRLRRLLQRDHLCIMFWIGLRVLLHMSALVILLHGLCRLTSLTILLQARNTPLSSILAFFSPKCNGNTNSTKLVCIHTMTKFRKCSLGWSMLMVKRALPRSLLRPSC